MTLSEAETKRRKAVEFLRRIGNDDLAEDFDSMDAEGYAAHKGAELIDNPSRRIGMAKSKAALQSELEDANSYIEELESKLDQIAGIASDDDEDSNDDDDPDASDDPDDDDEDEDQQD